MEAPTNIRLLKAVVIGLGVLILVMGAIVLGGIGWKAFSGGRQTSPAFAGAVVPISGLPSNFGTKKIELPRGSRIIDVRSEGERLILRIRHVGGGEQIQILHIGSGQRLGTVDIEPQD